MDNKQGSPEHTPTESEQEIAALKERVKWLSCQRYGRVLPGLLSFPGETRSGAISGDEKAESDRRPASDVNPAQIALKPGQAGVFRETPAPYRVSGDRKSRETRDSEGTGAGEKPPAKPLEAEDAAHLPREETILELPPRERAGMTAVGFEDSEAIAVRPAVVRRKIRRAMYASIDESGLAAAAPSPALFDDPGGGSMKFDASFVAWIAALRTAGGSFRAIADRLKREEGLAVQEETLRGLFLAAAETVEPVCSALFLRTIPDWNNLRRMFEESQAAGDWMAEEFLKKIHALAVLEENAVTRADRVGGAPEDLYRERRSARAQALRIVTDFFNRCRELDRTLAPGTPLAETVRYAVEHEAVLSEYLYDPRVEMTGAAPGDVRPDPYAVMELCSAECEQRGVCFRNWLEHVLSMRRQTPPAPPETLFPR